MRCRFQFLGICVALSVLAAAPGRASFTWWEVNEVFSNADGTIQFIEFFEASDFPGRDGQASYDGKQLKTFVTGANPNDPLDTHTFNDDLPSNFTAMRFALVATEGFASLPGAVEPDFVMPDGFIDTSVVVEIKLGTIDTFTFLLGAIPTDGVNSLHRTGAPVGENSPTNFAGETGMIDLPEPGLTVLSGAALACLAALRSCGAGPARRRL